MESNSNTPPIKSFTSRKPPITFDIDGEQFVAYQVLPAETFGRFAEKVLMLQRAGSDYEGPDKLDLTLSETVTVLLDAVELGLAADSAQRVATRLSDLDNPIDVSPLCPKCCCGCWSSTACPQGRRLGGRLRPPYAANLRLTYWLGRNWGWVSGELVLSGGPPP